MKYKFRCANFSSLILISLVSILPVHAKITLPSIFADGMVLQQNAKVAFWGIADSGQTLELTTSWDKEIYTVQTEENGRWKTKIKTPAAGGPFTLTIKSKNDETIQLKDVLIGEVWICSGQSNMDIMVKDALNADKELNDSNYPEIRFFKAAKSTKIVPIEDVKGKWNAPTKENVMNFGAVAFFFARNLHNHLHVPIGIIHTAFASSTQESWIAEEQIKGVGYAEKILEQARAGILDSNIGKQKVPTC